MSQKIMIVLIGFVLLGLVNLTNAGEIGENLQQQINSSSDLDMIPVWIKLYRVENGQAFKARINASSKSRHGRYLNAVTDLKEWHARAQTDLLAQLNRSKANAQANKIKSHWIANVIEAELTVAEINRLVRRADIEAIYAVPRIETAIAEQGPLMASSPATVGTNLSFINAPTAWALGYTGAGRIVCSFDTGVDGDHPALINGWKGHDGDSSAAWLDPTRGEPFPHVFTSDEGYANFNINHGTHTMGIMVGHDDNTGDTIGVAPGARWISAGVLDLKGASLIDGFEWAADPDRNPNTISDLPDVINHSWGMPSASCINLFYDMIDNVEALGIVNIFASGNNGAAVGSVLNPADRALTDLDCFAVGNIVIGTPPTIFFSSSRGPSPCNAAIKPNVSAPGALIRSSVKDGGYGLSTGTSMAAPHVSGLVALLRQKNPNATVDEIKNAILTSTNDFGYTLPDNDFGWGVIDCSAALAALGTSAVTSNLRVYSFDHAPISPGATVEGSMVIKNLGKNSTLVSGLITSSDPSVQVLNPSAFFGTIDRDDTVRTSDLIRVVISDTVTVGRIISLDFLISENSGAGATTKLHFLVEPQTERSYHTLDTGRVEFTVSNMGTYGLADGQAMLPGAIGFKFDGADNDLYESGLMIAVDRDSVSDGVRDLSGEPFSDFTVSPGGNLTLEYGGLRGNVISTGSFNDARAVNEIGIDVLQRVYGYGNIFNNQFVIMEYEIRNQSGAQLDGMYFGLYFDWDIISYNRNAGGYDDSGQFLWMGYNNFPDISDFRAIKILRGQLSAAMTQLATVVNPFEEREKFNGMLSGLSSADTYKGATQDLNQILAVGPLSIPIGGVDTVAFAIIAETSIERVRDVAGRISAEYLVDRDADGYFDLADNCPDNANVDQADSDGDGAGDICDSLVTAVEPDQNKPLPATFALNQNYPNPFNPSTTISFDIPIRSKVRLELFNLLGRSIKVLIDDNMSAGSYTIEWDGRDKDGDELASGVYFYRLSSDNYYSSKKMMMIK